MSREPSTFEPVIPAQAGIHATVGYRGGVEARGALQLRIDPGPSLRGGRDDVPVQTVAAFNSTVIPAQAGIHATVGHRGGVEARGALQPRIDPGPSLRGGRDDDMLLFAVTSIRIPALTHDRPSSHRSN